MTTSKRTDTDYSPADDKPGGSILPLLRFLQSAIWERRPILREIMQKHGHKTLYDYSRDFLDVNPSPRLDTRKHELITVVHELTRDRLGPLVAREVADQLTHLPLVSTADHHGFIDHPFWVNSNMISGIPYLESSQRVLRHLVVFSFSSVSLNNASAYPRGIEFHGGYGNFVRLPFLPDKLKMSVVYATRAFTADDLRRAEADLQRKQDKGEAEPRRGREILRILKDYFSAPDALAAPDLNAQITRVNHALWPKLFHPAVPNNGLSLDTPSPQRVPGLIYLEIETLVRELLVRYHLSDSASLLHHLLFDSQYRSLALKLFDSVPGAFSFKKQWGTYLFWGIDEKSHRVRLRPHNGFLESYDGRIVVPFTPDGIGQALRQKKIFPAMLLCYLVVSLYYGMKCLGGFCQVHDLTLTKRLWIELLKKMRQTEEAEAVSHVQTKELGGDGMVLAYLQTATGGLTPATGIDMILKRGGTRYEQYVELSKNITLLEAMQSLFPEIYTVLYPMKDRDPSVANLTPEQILASTGLQDRIKKTLYPSS